MGQLSESQRQWVVDFLGILSAGGATSKTGLASAHKGLGLKAGMAESPDGNGQGELIAAAMAGSAVMMAGPTGADGTTGGGTGSSTGGGTGGGSSGGPREKPTAWEVQPERVLKLAALNPPTPVHASVSTNAHSDAWLQHLGKEPPVPIAFQHEGRIFVDMSRWPSNMARPTTTHPSGGPKINPPTGQPKPAAEFPTGRGTSMGGDAPIGEGGRGTPPNNPAVPDDEIADRHKKTPSQTRYTFSSSAHEQIWTGHGNPPPAPTAFLQDGYMRVDVERFARQRGVWSTERLAQIGLDEVGARGKSGPSGSSGPKPPDYPGHREPNPDVYKPKALPNADMRKGYEKAHEAIKKPYSDPKSVWKANIPDVLKKRLDEFADVNSKVGKSVKKIDLNGKSAVELHKELVAAGFKHQWEPLAAGKDANGQQLYKLRNGDKTTNRNHPDVVPHDIYVHPDGGMVRVKPEGDPGDKFRPEPHASKSVLFDPARGTGFDNEAFKVTNEGDGVPKSPQGDAGMKQAPPSGPSNASINQGFKDATMSAAHTNLPKTSQAVGAPGGPGPAMSPTNLAQIEKSARSFITTAEQNHKEANSDKASERKVESQTVTLESDAEKLAKQLRDDPKLKGISGNAKEFFRGVKAQFSTVRGGVAGLTLIALNAADAYELVQAVRNILDSKSIDEAMKKSLQLGKAVAKDMITFGAIRFVTRSTPAAVFITVFIGDLDKNSRMTPREIYIRKIRDIVNKVRPGAVIQLGHMGTIDKYMDKDAEKLFRDAIDQADKLLTDQIANEVKRVGYEDALSGSKTKKKIELSSEQKAILPSLDDAWLATMYQKGHEEGDRQRVDAVKRVEKAGYKDGSEGKPANFEAIKKWPELRVLMQRYEKEKTTLTNDEIQKGQAIFNDYERSYNYGYAAGQKASKAIVLTKLDIAPNGFTMGAHTMRRLIATGTFNNKTTKNLSGDVSWQSSDSSVVNVSAKDGVAYAVMGKPGRVDVTAAYNGIHGAKEAKITIVVNPPTLVIRPENPTMKVGDKQQFSVYSTDKANEGFVAAGLDASVIDWNSDDQNRVAIDSEGNVTIRAPGPPVKIYASYKNTPVQVSTLVTVR